MDYIKMIINFTAANIESLLLGSLLLSVIILIAFISLNAKFARLIKKYNQLTEGIDGRNLEEIILEQGKKLDQFQSRLIDLKESFCQLEEFSNETISKVYFKRYNAFSEMGSDLSFSVAFLNAKNTGVMLTSIYGRDENRVYLKPIVNGKSNYALSPEEKEIISKCISN
mgnify:CR=1 FL=1